MQDVSICNFSCLLKAHKRVIVHRLFSLPLILLLGACTVDAGSRGTWLSNSNPANQQPSSSPNSQSPPSAILNSSQLKQKDPCLKVRRPLNPKSTPLPSETALDRYFRLAYDAASAGDFNTAIANYRQAAKAATCECDRSHAQAGEQAAKEAQELLRTSGAASKPTQFFWNQLQDLTSLLPCVIKQ